MERELWKSLYMLASYLDKPWGNWRYSNSDILAVFFWAVIHDRPTSWAANPQHWPDELRPALMPPQSTLSRRLRRTETEILMTAVEQHLLTLITVGSCFVYSVDGKGLPVSGVSKDPDARYGRGAGGFQKGYKLHAIWGRGPMPVAWTLAAMNVSEKVMARHLIRSTHGGGYMLADQQYDVNYLYDLADEMGFQLLAKKTSSRGRGGLGHRRQSPARLRSIELLETTFGCQLYKQRNAIERSFSAVTCFGGGLAPLPAWVRRMTRVRNWVHAKFLTAGTRWLLINTPQKLANA